MQKENREIVLLIGLPGSGKSTYIHNNPERFRGYTFLSIDDLVEKRAKALSETVGRSLTPDDIWAMPKEVAALRALRLQLLHNAVERGDNIVFEAVNDTPEIRKERLDVVKASTKFDYHKTAIIFHPQNETVHVDGLLKRGVSKGRLRTLETLTYRNTIQPLQQEEFDDVIEIGIPPKMPLYQEYKRRIETPVDKYIKRFDSSYTFR